MKGISPSVMGRLCLTLDFKTCFVLVRWFMLVIPALGMLEQEDAMSLNPACALYSKSQARQGDIGKTSSQRGWGGGGGGEMTKGRPCHYVSSGSVV